MTDYISYFNGEWVPLSQVRIDPDDRGFTTGDVVFDVERTFDGKTFRMNYHIARLYRSLQYARMDPGLSPDEMHAISEEVVARNEDTRAEVGDYYIRQFVTRGKGIWAHSAGPPSVCVRVSPIDLGRYAPAYSDGLHAVIARTRSYSPESLDSKIKHQSRMNFELAEIEAGDVDPEAWPLLLDLNGNITEGTSNNVFIVTDGVIRTPGDSTILQGGSRNMVLDLAKQLGIPVAQEELQPYDLYTSREVFFSRTGPCILPVTKVDNRTVADGKPGEITQQLLAAWSETVGVNIVDQVMSMT